MTSVALTPAHSSVPGCSRRDATDAGVTSATTANDATNGPMIAVNDALGYAPVGRWIRVQRRILR